MEVAMVEGELVEEAGKEADNKNITHRVPEVEEVEANDADTTSMATHKLPEMEPESMFLSLPASLASHLVLPVEWPETGPTTSMVSHQIYQPCTEYFEETIPAGACSPQLDQQYAKEDTLEENLRENLKDWLTGIDFKATYDNFEEDSLEATLAEDLPGNFAMANEAPIAVHQREHEVVEENVEEVDKKADTGDIDHKLPKEDEE